MWTFAFPRSSIFPSRLALLRSCSNIFFAFPCALKFLFRVPMLLCQRVYVWVVGLRLITRALCVYGRIRRPGQLATSPLPPPLVTRVRCTSILAGSRFGVISSQERKFSVPILPRSCIKFAFSRARAPKIPGTRARGNAKPGTRAHLCLLS